MSDISNGIDVYWRPGCVYCRMLRMGLERRRIRATWHNVWEDAEADAFVRRTNGGSQTVPTVAIGDTVLVNPSVREVSRLSRQSLERGA
ncbi:MAG: NrdH-redoxin [Actinomycetota bacterium]|nr:NrdH-redoxin [Actinomycetota bacterium]